MEAQKICPNGTTAVGGYLGRLHQEHTESFRKDNELYPARRGGLGIEEAAAAFGIAELEAHADEETNA